ncbi:hypothetical protein M406DRAFT_321541 [Cryphonectria parasitica EP155]|uniref:4-coumarate:coenzyme A ligase n=1 Tax=Cryphonectria parasitica (strain ATCC 38755 / EP155) TaxID=660469 RepID=A0A9P4Y6M8_CRYP1|nr:uncharacterized protein M406DRAFT_321541 [Cryphonectria parasitica EP155]KAF3767337.1 hypothetical protein M406DRAFT_321541 [Cryphonectria parasitica EP155]
MPVRIPKARSSELLTFGVGGLAAFAPFYMMLPGASERVASQTARWAPRWERNINYFTNPVERGTQFIAPTVERNVKRIDDKLPLERVARGVDRRIKKGIDRVGAAGSSWPKRS